MIINEIIDTTVKNYEFPTKANLGKNLGNGSYARVFAHPRDPHMVMRVERDFSSHEFNGYFRWFSLLGEKAGHNPYLPRIYEIQGKQMSEKRPNQWKFAYTLEKLHDAEKLIGSGKIDKQNIIPIVDEVLNKAAAKTVKRSYPTYAMWENMAWNLYDRRINSSNTLLLEAFALIDRANLRLDIHEKNIMLRLTPTGPQLVLTDPIH